MTDNTSRLTILIDPETKKKLESLADKTDLTVSQIIRKLVKAHLKDYEVSNALLTKG